MSIPFSNTHYRIPQGFGNLLEGLTREILREQPENIPAFAAAYFENLLEKREKTNFDPAEWGAKVDDRFYNNHAFKEQESPENCESEKEKSPPSVKEDETPVTAFESSEEEKQREEDAALKIQAAFRGHLAREEVKKMKSGDAGPPEFISFPRLADPLLPWPWGPAEFMKCEESRRTATGLKSSWLIGDPPKDDPGTQVLSQGRQSLVGWVIWRPSAKLLSFAD